MSSISNIHDTLEMKIHDISLRYSGCFFKLEGVVYYISGFVRDDDNTKIYVHAAEVMNRGRTGSYKPIEVTDEVVASFKTPPLGYVNIGRGVCFISRLAKRRDSYKYIRGLCPGVIRVEFPNSPLSSDSDFNDFSIAKALLLNDLFPTIQQAIDSIYKFEKYAVAISRNLACILNFSRNRIVLYSRGVPIGVYVHLKKEFRLFTTSFNDELDDLGVPYFNSTVPEVYKGGETVKPKHSAHTITVEPTDLVETSLSSEPPRPRASPMSYNDRLRQALAERRVEEQRIAELEDNNRRSAMMAEATPGFYTLNDLEEPLRLRASDPLGDQSELSRSGASDLFRDYMIEVTGGTLSERAAQSEGGFTSTWVNESTEPTEE